MYVYASMYAYIVYVYACIMHTYIRLLSLNFGGWEKSTLLSPSQNFCRTVPHCLPPDLRHWLASATFKILDESVSMRPLFVGLLERKRCRVRYEHRATPVVSTQ